MTKLQGFVTRLIKDCSDLDVLEFGNKKNPTGIYRDWYIANGAKSYVSIDINGLDGALKRDVQLDLGDLGEFDLVTNFGFSEHVQDQVAFWENAIRLTRVGGRLVNSTPDAGERLNHNCYWHTPASFYENLAALNELEVLDRFVEQGLMNYALRKTATMTIDLSIPIERLWPHPGSKTIERL